MELRKQSFKAFYPSLENPHIFVQSKKTQGDLDDILKNIMIPRMYIFKKPLKSSLLWEEASPPGLPGVMVTVWQYKLVRGELDGYLVNI